MREAVDTPGVPLVSRVADDALGIFLELFDNGRNEVLKEWIKQIRLFLIFVELSGRHTLAVK
jgi:hypothetical protein